MTIRGGDAAANHKGGAGSDHKYDDAAYDQCDRP